MGFRNDEVAAHARAEALEQRVRELEADNERLRVGAHEKRGRGLRLLPWILGVVSVLLMAAAFYSGFVVSGYVGEQVGLVLGTLSSASLFAAVLVGVVGALLAIGQPNEVLVLSGRRYVGPDGARGYRVVVGGRVLRIPLLERLDRLDASPIPFELELRRVVLKGGEKRDVSLRGRVRIVPSEPLVHQAVERFLGKPRAEIAAAATESLEGSARDALAALSPSELEEDRLKVKETILVEATQTLSRLGLELDDLNLDLG